jgi:chemotaxis protein methyltransferase CheR
MEEVKQDHVSDSEVDILLNDLLEIFGYDFTNYSLASVKRRINRIFSLDRFTSFADFRKRIITDERYISRFIQEITVNVTEMFRDPGFYATIREKVIPVLSTHPFIRIWHAGCSTGEEVYSMAICLRESNLLHKSLLYATDINTDVLAAVDRGIFPLGMIRQYSENYLRSGGTEDFSKYYTAKYDLAKFDEGLREKMIVSTHNLVSDGSFNEFQLIICRNVLIYFNKGLQERVFNLFDASLEKLGFIGLGSKEQIRFSNVGNKYSQLDPREKIWRKMI